MQNRTLILATDQQNSVMAIARTPRHPSAYDVYGHEAWSKPYGSRFNGEYPMPLTGRYLLGNGYRAYSTLLRRFLSPDSFSPFGKGGINCYAYCTGDPVNRFDPSGHIGQFAKFSDQALGALVDLEFRTTLAASLNMSKSKFNRLVPNRRVLAERTNKVGNAQYWGLHQRKAQIKSQLDNPKYHSTIDEIVEHSDITELLNHIESKGHNTSKLLIASDVALGLDATADVSQTIGHRFIDAMLGPAYGAPTAPNLLALYGARRSVFLDIKDRTTSLVIKQTADTLLTRDLQRIRATL